MSNKNQNKTQTQPCKQNVPDLQKIADEVRVKLRQGVELSNGNMVSVNLSVYHLTYVKLNRNDVEVVYTVGCVSVHVTCTVGDEGVEIRDVSLHNLCSDTYGV